MTDLSICVVSWNTKDLLAQCLASVYANTQDITFEVFVVDNASGDGSAQMVRERFPQVRLIENSENVGFAKANNQAIRESAGRCVLLLNSDTVVQPDALTQMIIFMDAHPDAGIVGGKLLDPDRSFQASYGDFPTFVSELLNITGLAKWLYGRYYPSHPPEESCEARAVDWVGGACLMARRTAIEQVGLPDEGYFMYSEEVDWCYRFHQAGWKIYFLPDAQIVHLGGQSSRLADEKKLLWLWRSRVRFLSKHRNVVWAWTLQGCLRIIGAVKTAFWFCIGSIHQKEREVAWRKVRANWRLATFNES